MNDSVTIQDKWIKHTQSVAEANRRNKNIVFDALSAAGITHVCVSFDGEGDQGQIEDASAQADGKSVEFPSVTLTVYRSQFDTGELINTEMNVSDAVEQLCYGYLEQEHGGWEIDDGSHGIFAFDVAARKIALDFNARFTDSVHSGDAF